MMAKSEAQTPDHDSVKAVINQLFEGMRGADSAMVVSAFWPNAILQTIATAAGTATVVKNQTVFGFGSSVAARLPGQLDEQIVWDALHINGDLASAWTPYKFFFKGKLLHSGANSFQLVRIAGLWKIQYLIDTRIK
ncbi:MAG: hypothetical protein EAY75_03820 [Bacteroidetes bacterium]|nr:MAG: hypothetical protein EAY75_03820 [Bacteroidota bacterium]